MNDNEPRSTIVAETLKALADIGRAKDAATRPTQPRPPARLTPEQLDASYRAAGVRNPRWRPRLAAHA